MRYYGSEPVESAAEFISYPMEEQIRYVFLTNNSAGTVRSTTLWVVPN